MTHSHDTSTPAMSAETVPSEELARALQPFSDAVFYDNGDVSVTPVCDRQAYLNAYFSLERYRFFSASHLAKEGGEAGAILRAALQEYGLDENVLSEAEKLGRHSAVRGMMVRLKLYPVFCDLLAKDATDDEIDASLPQPSPPLAKGGDAVREALRNQIAKQLENEADVTPDEEDASVVRRCARLVRVNFSYDDADAALSTPTEGPASQTEGMGGGALHRVVSAAIQTYMKESHEHGGSHGISLDEAVKSAEAELAALTPPETAEVVPVAWPNGCDQTVPEALRFLANNDRPSGGEQRFNSAHLYQLADEIEKASRLSIHPQAKCLREELEKMRQSVVIAKHSEAMAVKGRQTAQRELADAVKALETAREAGAGSADKATFDRLCLWFFRDLHEEQRLALFKLFGWPVEEITDHGREKMVLREIVMPGRAARSASSQGGE